MDLGLRSSAALDLPFVIAAERAEHARDFVTLWPEERHMAAILDGDQEHLLLELAAQPVGFVLLAGLADRQRNVELRRIVLVRPGEGLGRKALGLALARIFEEHHAHRVWLDVKPGNARARHLYSSMGFLEEGIQGDESLVLMSMRHKEWEARRRACENSAGAAVMP